MAAPSLKASMESGATWNGPSEDLLFELPSDIDRGKEQFVIVERLRDPSGETYAQSMKEAGGSYLLGRRDGSQDSHFRVEALTMRQAHEVLTAWAFELPDWDTRFQWQRVTV